MRARSRQVHHIFLTSILFLLCAISYQSFRYCSHLKILSQAKKLPNEIERKNFWSVNFLLLLYKNLWNFSKKSNLQPKFGWKFSGKILFSVFSIFFKWFLLKVAMENEDTSKKPYKVGIFLPCFYENCRKIRKI